MSYYSDTYAKAKNRLLDWLIEDNSGGNVDDLALDLLNRARKSLWAYRPWQFMVKESTLDASTDAQVLPSDIGRVLDVYHDPDSNGKGDYHYYNNSAYSDNGYKIRSTYTKAAGHGWTLQFYQSPSNTPKLVYQAVLEEFTGTDTEYLFFPAELLVLEAQKIKIGESGIVDNEYTAVLNRHAEVLRDYEQSAQYQNYDMRVVQNDFRGDRIETDQYSIDGSTDGLESGTFEPDYDCSGRC